MNSAVVIGSGAGGAMCARELQGKYQVTVLEAGREFRPSGIHLGLVAKLRRTGLLFDARTIEWIFPAMKIQKTGAGMILASGHGSGGRLMNDMIDHSIREILGRDSIQLDDSAIITPGSERIAFTTDTFTITPIEFPGGDIGSLAVNGTVNDLAVMGAVPRWLSCGLILEEGLDALHLAGPEAAHAVLVGGVTQHQGCLPGGVLAGQRDQVGAGLAAGVVHPPHALVAGVQGLGLGLVKPRLLRHSAARTALNAL